MIDNLSHQARVRIPRTLAAVVITKNEQ